MPLTPFHLGPALFLGLLFFSVFDLPTFLISNVIVDLEPFIIISLGLDYPLHGFFHSFLGGTIVAALLAIIIFKTKGRLAGVMKVLKLRQDSSFKKILFTALSGIYFHILLDSFLYTDIKPFYPLEPNPLYGVFSFSDVYLFCIFSFFAGAVLYFLRAQFMLCSTSKRNKSQRCF